MPQQVPVYISTSAIIAKSPLAALEGLFPLTQCIELTGGCDHDPDLLEKLLAYRAAHPVDLLLHSYFPPPKEQFVLNFADTGDGTRAFIVRAMEYVQALDVPYYSVHAGFRGDFTADGNGLLHKRSDQVFTFDGIKENVRWYYSRWPGIPLALENIYPNNGNTSCAFMMSLSDIMAALDAMPDVFLLLDLGHLKISANLLGFDFNEAVETIFRCYGSRILEIHLSENGGDVDDHLPVSAASQQYSIVREYATFIRKHAIRVTLETRSSTLGEIISSYELIQDELNAVAVS